MVGRWSLVRAMTQTATPPFPPTPVRWGLATWAKILIGFTLATTLGVVLLCSGVIYLGLRAPATRALRGSQLPERHVETIRRLELLDEGVHRGGRRWVARDEAPAAL